MRVLRFLAFAAVAALVGSATGCSTTVSGRGTFAGGAVSGSPTGPASTDPASTDPASPTVTETSESPTPTPSTTVDPVKVKRRVTCLLVQASVKSINDRFNAAKSRPAQLSILRSGVTTIDAALKRSELPPTDGVYTAGGRISNELRKLVIAASKGGSPSTRPYNAATTRFRTLCASL